MKTKPSRAASTRQSPKPGNRKRKLLKHSALGLAVLVLSFSTISASLAFIGVGPIQQILDIYGRATGDPDAETANETVGEVGGYLRQAEEFYRNISRKNVSGILGQLESILGDLGILSPKDYPGTIGGGAGAGGGSPTGPVAVGDPVLPDRIYEQQQLETDSGNTDGFWAFIEGVLGKDEGEGQERITGMKEVSLTSNQLAMKAQEKSSSVSQQAFQNAELAKFAADETEKLSKQAQGRKASQDILKDIAAQQSEVAKSNTAMANQLATLSDQQAAAAAQTAALATQSQVANEHLTELRVGQAMGNLQLHDIFNAQRHANHIQVTELHKNSQLAVGASSAIYLPGLLPAQAQPESN